MGFCEFLVGVLLQNEFVLERFSELDIKALHEENPMLGCRGCRLGILHPEITEMQTRAIFEAAAQVLKGKKRVKVNPEIMIPLVGFREELADQLRTVHRIAAEVMKSKKVKIKRKFIVSNSRIFNSENK